MHDGPKPPFVFRPTNLRSGAITFRYVRSGPDGTTLASGSVAFRSANEQLGALTWL
jgi:hypothetical protein